jgi:ATP-dependent DNA helicase RecG
MIPIKLKTLLDGEVVDSDRVEYKQGWNPADTVRTICTYANDFNNTNGGYIIIGIEENHGRSVLPPAGVAANDLDRIQQEIFQYCNEINPRYIPRIEIGNNR